METLNLIIKPTHACNARCVYCSAWNGGGRIGRMSDETLIRIFQRIEEWVHQTGRVRRLKLIWHGGEPTLMPAAFYQKVLALEQDLIDKLGLEIENSIQSNLLMMDDQKLNFIKELLTLNGTGNLVGTSAEPLQGIRLLKQGDYHQEWERGISLLRERDIPFGIVYVVHQRSLRRIDEICQYFLENFPRTGIRFNPLYREGKAQGEGCDSLSISPREWGEFMIKLYRIWEEADKRPGWHPIKAIDDFHFHQKQRLSCDQTGRCGQTHLGIDWDGTVYSCGRGIDRRLMAYGNLMVQEFSKILQHPARREILNRVPYLKNTHCLECEWWSYCHGGCPMDTAIYHDDEIFHRSSICPSRRLYLRRIYKEPRI